VSPRLDDLAAALSGAAPLLRLALHPRDAHHPALVRRAQGLLEQLLASRQALTKAEFARQLAGQLPTTDPTRPQAPSANVHTRHSSGDSHSARHPPWH
jgi:hypothetical protein